MKAAIRDSLAITFAATLPLAMAWLGFVALANESDREHSLLASVYAVGKAAQFTFPLLYVGGVAMLRRGTERSSIVAWRSPWTVSQGIMVGLAFAAIVDLSAAALYFGALRDSPWLAGTPAKIFGKLQEFHLATPTGYLAIGLFVCVLHSFLEEYYWRWFVFGWMRRYLTLRWSIGLSSLAFMAHHVVILYVYFPGHFWTLAAPLSLGVAVGGAVWAWLYDRSGSLLGPWLSHVAIDAGILLIGYDLLRGMW